MEKHGHRRKLKSFFIYLFSCLFILLVWYVVSRLTDQNIIFPAPQNVVRRFVRMFADGGEGGGKTSFVRNVLFTVRRTGISFAIIVSSGFWLGLGAGSCESFSLFMKPLLAVLKATPLMSVVLIAFFWLGSGKVPVFSAFLMGFPIMFVQTVNAVQNLDRELLEMCKVFRICGLKKLLNFTLPALLPAFLTGAKQSLALVWKVVIAAEVVVLPLYGMGRSMQFAQVSLDTELVFVWTFVAVFLSLAGDFFFSCISRLIKKRYCPDVH